jgi:hypothetical protein
MNHLKSFHAAAKKAVQDIEAEITDNLLTTISPSEGENQVGVQIKGVQIKFPEFNGLRDAISGTLTLVALDTNDRELEVKGSGIQRLVLLSLISYVSEKTPKKIIWGIDEPELFLQSSLQRKVSHMFDDLSQKYVIFLTTHSQQFIDLSNLDNTYLFTQNDLRKRYRNNNIITASNTSLSLLPPHEKAEAIKKQFGILRNDNWSVMPFNLVVEGNEDREYILALCKKLRVNCPNIFASGGAQKIKSDVNYINDTAKDMGFVPDVVALFDSDSEGKAGYNSLASKEFPEIKLRIEKVVNCDGFQLDGIEIEDLIYPTIIYEAVNEILMSKDYNLIDLQIAHSSRTQPAHSSENILSFINYIVKSENENLSPLNFNDQSMKQRLCREACRILMKKKINELNNLYPEVRVFLQKLTDR